MPLICETAFDVLRRLTDQRRRRDEWEVSRRSGWAESEATTLSLLIRWSGLVTPCYTSSHSVMFCHILSNLVTPFHTLSHPVIPCYIFSHHVNLVIPCQSTCLTREQLIVPCWLSQHTYWQIKIKPAFHKSKSNWRCHEKPHNVIKLIFLISWPKKLNSKVAKQPATNDELSGIRSSNVVPSKRGRASPPAQRTTQLEIFCKCW